MQYDILSKSLNTKKQVLRYFSYKIFDKFIKKLVNLYNFDSMDSKHKFVCFKLHFVQISK